MVRTVRWTWLTLVISLMMLGVGPAHAGVGDTRPGAEAGFVKLDPIKYKFVIPLKKDSLDVPFTTTESRIFYTFQPADKSPETAPLFVFHNGGPGAATTANFFANNTAPYSINLGAVGKDTAGVVKNPHSWTSMGNLLYIDPSQSGFSYNVSDEIFSDPEYGSVLKKLWTEYWNAGNFNAFIDADQLLRVILTFLAKHPELAQREVVMVGESYGGVRVSTILHMLMNSADYDTNGSSFFRDPGMASMIRTHFKTGDKAPSPEVVSKQFDRQVLVQPQLSSYQDEEQGKLYWAKDSVIDDVAKAAKTTFSRSKAKCWWFAVLTKNTCVLMVYLKDYGRDRYDWAQRLDYSDDQDAYSNKAMRDVRILTTMLGVKPQDIPMLKKSERGNAYHTMGFPVIGDDERPTQDTTTLKGVFGTLDAPDSYYVSWNEVAYAASSMNLGSVVRSRLPISPDKDPLFGDMFLENLKYVRTFLTDAKRDLVIFSDAMAPALARHTGLVKGVSTREENWYETGRMSVTWKDDTTTHIRWPLYRDAGHAVAMTMPDKLLVDVNDWIDGQDAGWSRRHLEWNPGNARLAAWKSDDVRLRLTRPAVKSGSLLLLPAKAKTFAGVLTFRHGKKAAALRRVSLQREHLVATVDGRRIRLMSVAGNGQARLTAPGARTLNNRLDVDIFEANTPVGRLVERLP